MTRSITIILISGIIISNLHDLKSQAFKLDWMIKTDGKIVAGSVVDGDKVYIGNESGTFYAIDIETGLVIWKSETTGSIQGKAIINDDLLYYESANTFYAVQKSDGQEVWRHTSNSPPEKFTYGEKDFLYKLDFFDDKRASGVIHEDLLYVSTTSGQILGLDKLTGQVKFTTNSIKNSPIRSTPLVNDGRLYFGDWNGIVYCHDLINDSPLWNKETYREKLYDTFGGIASEFIVYKGMLYFGARNHMLNVLWLEDGQKEWTYTDTDGGWLIGDPVIFSDTLYVGGSDNFSILAFDPANGKLLWKTKRAKNIYGKPVVTDDWIIYTGGNSYNPGDKGEIVILDRKNGDVLASQEVSSSAFSSPILSASKSVIFGSIDGTIYSYSIEQ